MKSLLEQYKDQLENMSIEEHYVKFINSILAILVGKEVFTLEEFQEYFEKELNK